jgi:hypothetical protein
VSQAESIADRKLRLQNGEKSAPTMSVLVERPPRRQPARKAHDHAPRGSVAALTLGALGVEFGSVGTSPLYAMDQIFRAAGALERPTPRSAPLPSRSAR